MLKKSVWDKKILNKNSNNNYTVAEIDNNNK